MGLRTTSPEFRAGYNSPGKYRLNCGMAPVAITILSACMLLPAKICASTIIAWDWNDGTTQGWTGGGGTAANIGNRLGVTDNADSGSLQFIGPALGPPGGESNVDLRGLSTISFDLSITSFSGVASPSDLTTSRLLLQTVFPGAEPLIRQWDLDLSNLTFGQTRAFNLSVLNAIGSGSLTDAGFFSLEFSGSGLNLVTASGLLDNFVVSGATVPEPSSILLLCTGTLGLCAAHRRYKRHQSRDRSPRL